jgi:hypothetical protein
MTKKIFFLSLCAGIFSFVACFVFNRIYIFAFGVDFTKLVNTGSLLGFNLAGCLFAGMGYMVAKRFSPKHADIIFNIVFTMLSFASIYIPIATSIPTDIQNPELFPGLAITMHFFPAIGWYTLKPMFI